MRSVGAPAATLTAVAWTFLLFVTNLSVAVSSSSSSASPSSSSRVQTARLSVTMSSVSPSSSSSSSRMQAARAVVQNFPANPFVPRGAGVPLFGAVLANAHVQTIWGSGALQQKALGNPRRPFNVESERLETPDGDFIDLEFVTPTIRSSSTSGSGTLFSASGKTVVVLHGLESNTKGQLVTNMAAAFVSKGFECCLVSFRGCSGEPNRTPGAYHIGMTRDVDLVCRTIRERRPREEVYLSGFSLGGNVILKYLGELGDAAAATRNICGAAVTCVPFDCTATQKKVDGGLFNRLVYAGNFLKSLKRKAEQQHVQFPRAFDIERIRACTTIGEFDDAYIAPIYGFRNKEDYYAQSASKQYLRRIAVPTVAINALDDPLVDMDSLPTDAADVGDAPVRLIYHANGGHCGFDADPHTSYVHGPADPPPPHGWLAEELARTLTHIQRNSVTGIGVDAVSSVSIDSTPK